jgi:hypothetical protein
MVTEENISKCRPYNKFLRCFCILIILASGIAIGAGGTIMLMKQRIIWKGHPHKDANDLTKDITEKYGLNPQQSTQVQGIIINAFQRKKLADAEEDIKREARMQTMIMEMNSVLTPQQFEQWSKDFQAFRDKHKKPKK